MEFLFAFSISQLLVFVLLFESVRELVLVGMAGFLVARQPLAEGARKARNLPDEDEEAAEGAASASDGAESASYCKIH